ncbi:MAG TPA: toll/interleukin-1 receptor domain-containing protein [Candidatus Hydrogenedentes bacterium]|jgi:hypothetical protein|nr:toll/interleukin-1 receptor domain-containing protein [Candidatus Hydrogenedentota bacterium]HOS77687.1 toll/interleukin-1 receptor domain-containing protein [Syntrophales bacterium]
MQNDVFISYSRKDKKYADELRRHLADQGVSCWIDREGIHPGEDWTEMIGKALRSVTVMVLLYSSSARDSENVKDEVAIAAKRKLAFVPILLEDVEPDEFFEVRMARYSWEEIFHHHQERFAEVAAGIKRRIEKLQQQQDVAQEAGSSPEAPDWPRTGQAYLRAIASVLHSSRLPIKPLSVTWDNALKNGLFASWQLTGQHFLGIMLRIARSSRPTVQWGIYNGKNKAKDPFLRCAYRQVMQTKALTNQGGDVSINGIRYCLSSTADYLGFQTARALAADLSRPEVAKLHAEQMLAFVEKIWPAFQTYVIGGAFLSAVLSATGKSTLPFEAQEKATDRDIAEKLDVKWRAAKRHYYSVRLPDALRVQWGLYSDNTIRDRSFSAACQELQQHPELADGKGNLVIGGCRYRYRKTARYHGLISSESRTAAELRDTEFAEAFAGQLLGFMNATWPVVQKHLVNPKPQP